MVAARKISWAQKKKKRKENIAAKDVKFGIEMGRKDMKYTV